MILLELKSETMMGTLLVSVRNLGVCVLTKKS